VSAACLIFAGGGTGGHVYPMLAVADAVHSFSPLLRLVFVGSERGMEKRVLPERGYELELMNVLPIRGRGVLGAARGIARAARLLPESRALLKRLQPRAVFSIGGYAAGPLSLAARSLGMKLALMEPNSVIGLANRLISPFVQRAYTAFPESERHFKASVVLRCGVPIRDGFVRAPFSLAHEGFRILVLGGSQGAKALNDAVPRALATLGLPLTVVHQAGRAHASETEHIYAELGFGERAEVVPFISDMPAALRAADLVIGRSGASAVSEICAIGRPSLLIPYPYASGDHQRLNAESLARAEAAVWIPSALASAERVAAEVRALLACPQRLAQMAASAAELGRPEAARTIALDLLSLAGLSVAENCGGDLASSSRSAEPSRSFQPLLQAAN
jgi:UDP-N-acetylglucosamine--N-acetylmuramyl-(pentapeptide) pyrophosphoryl-undecaprenol N-acetylglucosamine transferase